MYRSINWSYPLNAYRSFAKIKSVAFNKYLSTHKPYQSMISQQLSHRSLIRISGTHASDFLQGLITNDMQHLEDDQKGSIYAVMLNHQGRLLYDVIIYATELDSFLIECDSALLQEVFKHLKMYRVRKKVDIATMEDLSVWSVFRNPDILLLEEQEKIDVELKSSDGMYTFTRDPRLKSLGWRFIMSGSCSPKEIILNHTVEPGECYRTLLYKVGIGEGVNDLPPGACLPLECNADYLHGISFHKGCYIGQELTARTHHTGVVRKRLLPLDLKKLSTVNELEDSNIVNADGKKVGKFRSRHGDYGIGLLRIQECLNSAKMLQLQGIDIATYRPYWWPIEAPKESPGNIRNE